MQINEIDNLLFGVKYKLIPPDELAQRLKQNVPYSQIAREFNVPDFVVTRSVKHRLTSFSDYKVSKNIYSLYLNKYSVEEIKNVLGYPLSYIRSVISRFKDNSKSQLESEHLIHSIVDRFDLDPDVLKNLK